MSKGLLRATWHFRGFIISSVAREFSSRYQNSLFGAAWSFINPLAMIAVYTIIFSRVMGARLPGADGTYAYSIYLCSGILTWGFFSEVVGRSQTIFIESAGLIKKLNFPRICLPVIVVLTASINFGIIFLLFLIFSALVGHWPGWPLFAAIPVLLIQVIFSISLGIIVGTLNVFFRDVGHFFSVLLQFWFWFTPIVYPISIVPDRLKDMMLFNPMAGVMSAYHTIFYSAQWPNWSELMPVLIIAMCLLTIGLWLFRTHSGDMVDEL